MNDAVEKTDSETLRKWLVNNTKLLREYDPAKEREQLQRCQMHIRDIRAELASRAKAR